MAQAHKKYLAIMKGLRIALPLVLAIILCVIFFWPMVSEHLEKTDTQASGKKKIDLSHITDNRLVTPSYSAVDDKGNPYSVNAEWANQLDKNTIELNAPRGEITLENQEKISVTGESGLYQHEERQLQLNGPVTLDSDRDQHLTGHDIKVDLKTKTMTTNSKVEGQIMGGKISAQDGFQLESNEGKKTITLKGKSHVTLNPQKLKEASQK